MILTVENRKTWADAVRGVAFAMVIYSHNPYCNSKIMSLFAPVFLTSFFFISGYFYKDGFSFKQILEQRTRTLLIPYFSLGLLMILMNYFLSFTEYISFYDRFMGLVLLNGTNEILWFVGSLYVYSLLFFFVRKIDKSNKVLLIVSIFLFTVNCLYTHTINGIHIPWHIDTFGFACSYMGLGFLYKKNEAKIDRYFNKFKVFLLLLLYILVIYVLDWQYISYFGSNKLIDSLFITTLGLIILVYFSKYYFFCSSFFVFMGQNTLFYFAFHSKINSILAVVFNKIFQMGLIQESYVTTFFLGFVFVLIISLVLIYPAKIVNNYLPALIGKGYKLWE